MSRKSLNKRHACLDAEFLLRVFRNLIFCVQTHVHRCRCRRMHTDADTCSQTQAHRTWINAEARWQTQTHVKFFSYIPCPNCYMFRPWVSPPTNLCPTLLAFQEPENTVGAQSIISKTPPTNLQGPELTYPWKPSLILEYVLLRGLGCSMVFVSCRQLAFYLR